MKLRTCKTLKEIQEAFGAPSIFAKVWETSEISILLKALEAALVESDRLKSGLKDVIWKTSEHAVHTIASEVLEQSSEVKHESLKMCDYIADYMFSNSNIIEYPVCVDGKKTIMRVSRSSAKSVEREELVKMVYNGSFMFTCDANSIADHLLANCTIIRKE